MIPAALLIAFLAAAAGEGPATVEARVTVDRAAIPDAPRDSGYVVTTLRRGDVARVRPGEAPGVGWLAIDPPGSVFVWVDLAAIRRPESDRERPNVAIVRTATAVRSANPDARIPGPPWATLNPGDRIRLVDVPPLVAGGKRWAAAAPPTDRPVFIPADAVEWVRPQPAELQPAAYVAADDENPELKRIDAMLLAETAGRPVEDWRLESIRAAYEDLASRSGGNADQRRAVETRLHQLAGLERASEAARGFVAAASRSAELDRAFDRLERRLEDAERERSRAFDAVGFVQPSARMHQGRKLFALIGLKDGAVSAYLDVPPGLNANALTARRVGVRGSSRHDPEMKARLITVRDLIDLESRE